MSVSSSPATFSVDGFSTSESVTFAIPAGTYTSATWAYTGTSAGPADPYGCIAYTSGGVNTASFPTHSVVGTVTDSVAASASQLADINSAAGGSLSAGFSLDGLLVGTEIVNVSSFTLTLYKAQSVIVPSVGTGPPYSVGIVPHIAPTVNNAMATVQEVPRSTGYTNIGTSPVFVSVARSASTTPSLNPSNTGTLKYTYEDGEPGSMASPVTIDTDVLQNSFGIVSVNQTLYAVYTKVSYSPTAYTIKYKSSSDGGATWSSATTIADPGKNATGNGDFTDDFILCDICNDEAGNIFALTTHDLLRISFDFSEIVSIRSTIDTLNGLSTYRLFGSRCRYHGMIQAVGSRLIAVVPEWLGSNRVRVTTVSNDGGYTWT